MPFQDIPNLGLWSTDFLTGETWWSHEMFVIYGLKPNSVAPAVDLMVKFTHPDDRDGVSKSIHLATKTLKPFNFFYRIVRKDKGPRSLFSSGAFEMNSEGKPIARYGVSLNLTGLTKEEMEELKRKLNGFVVPARVPLNDLDPSNIQVELLREIALRVSERMDSRISKIHPPE